MNKFKVGDRVEFIKQCYVAKPGEKGTVRVIENRLFGVETDNNIGGHDLDGRCKSGHGCWSAAAKIRLLENRFEIGQIYRVGKLSSQHQYENAIVKLVGNRSFWFTVKAIRGEAPNDFGKCSEYARSLTLLTGPQIGAAIKKYDADHAEKKTGVREVKRHAKPGERIKVVYPILPFGYKCGDVLHVTKEFNANSVICEGARICVCDSEYVVLEGYKPEQKGRRFYNQKEIAEAKAFVLDTIRDLAEKDVHVILAHSSGDEDDNGAFTCYILNHDAFIDADEDGFKAEAKRYGSVCSDNDEPNEWIGKCVALCKALHKPIPAFIMGD